MTRHPGTPAAPAPAPGGPATAEALLAASDDELVTILAAADQADIAMHRPGGLTRPAQARRPAPGTTEIVLLGALGCRYGMLAGGAGGYLLRTPGTSILVDPGPAAHPMLAGMHGSKFDWAELDAIVCTHFHPDHYAGIIPCLEGMASYALPGTRKLLAANPTTTARFAAFSSYHAGQMADLITLAHPRTRGTGEPAVKISDLTIHAIPAAHTEEPAHRDSSIGLAFGTPAGGIWHSSDTTLADGLLDAVAEILPDTTLVIAHADASNISEGPQRSAACHLQTRDVLPIAGALRPRHILIQHYDAAYSAPEYRIAQAIWLQRRIGTAPGSPGILPGTNLLRITLTRDGVTGWDLPASSHDIDIIARYLELAGPATRHRQGHKRESCLSQPADCKRG